MAHDLHDDVQRAYANLAATSVRTRDYALAGRHLSAGIAYARERDLDSYLLYITGWNTRWLLDQGRWAEAATSAAEVLDDLCAAAPARITPLLVVGLLHARRGDADPWEPLDEALALAERTGELQRLGPVAAARAEAHWLAGEFEAVAAATERALALAVERDDQWAIGELAVWRRRAGIGEPTPPVAAEPFRLEL